MTSSPCTTRRVLAGAALACVAVLVSACGASGGSAAPAVTVTITRTPTAGAGAPGSTGGSTAPASSSPAPAGPPACATRALRVTRGISQGTAGSVLTLIDFKNISGVTCTLFGFPGVSFITTGTGGRVIGAPAARSPQNPAKLVTLAPGASANANLQIADAGNFPASTCTPVTAHWLQIYPPNQTTPTFLSFTSPTCSKPVRVLVVGVVLPGTGSSS